MGMLACYESGANLGVLAIGVIQIRMRPLEVHPRTRDLEASCPVSLCTYMYIGLMVDTDMVDTVI